MEASSDKGATDEDDGKGKEEESSFDVLEKEFEEVEMS